MPAMASIDFGDPAGVFHHLRLARGQPRRTLACRGFSSLAEAIWFVLERRPEGEGHKPGRIGGSRHAPDLRPQCSIGMSGSEEPEEEICGKLYAQR
jgi:hypothetical protein